MNLLRGVLLASLLLGPILAAANPAGVGACPTACMAEKDHCVAKLGAPSEDNCKDGMRLCIERCNPTGQNTAAFDAAEERARNSRITDKDTPAGRQIRACEQRCEVSSTLCPRNGVSTNECGLGRQACIDRCYGK